MQKIVLLITLLLIINTKTHAQIIFKTFYYENGGIRSQGSLDTIHKLKVGVWKDFYSNGKIKSIQKCNDKDAQGYLIETIYIKGDGQIEELRKYICKKTGEWINYYENGKVSWKVNYEKGRKVGLEIAYHPNGKIKVMGNHNNTSNSLFENPKDGIWKRFYEDGSLEFISKYDKGVKIGKWIAYFRNGNVWQKFNHKKGVLNGKNKVYYESGKIRGVSHYKMDKIHGKLKKYYENGKLKVIYVYNHGKLVNVLKCYDLVGNSLDSGSLTNGNGTINIYDNMGNFEKSLSVVNGEIKNSKQE